MGRWKEAVATYGPASPEQAKVWEEFEVNCKEVMDSRGR